MARVIKNPSGFHSRGRTAREKASHFGAYAKEHGWTGKWSEDDESGLLHLFARRGENETIDIWWIIENGAAHPDMLPIYTLAGEKIKCRNVSAAAAMAAKSPDENRLKKAVRKQKRQLGIHESGEKVTQEQIELLQTTLPFDHESTDEEVLDALYGRTITWINRISGETDTATVGGTTKHCKVVRNGHDFISFVNPIPQRVLAQFGKAQMDCDTYGFRAVYLDSIVSVD